MTEEIKTPPVEKQDKEVKSAEDVIAELKALNESLKSEKEKLETQVKEKDSFIGKQSTEIGELRKSTPQPETVSEKTDELEKEIADDLIKDGMDKETAEYNAKLLAKMGKKILARTDSKKMMGEVIDLIDESLDEGKIDRAIFKENENEIMAEFRGRKLAPTARQTFKIFRDCVDVVIKRKADVLKKEQEKKSEKEREELIASGQQPPSGKKVLEKTDEEEKQLRAIRDSGTKRDSAFF